MSVVLLLDVLYFQLMVTMFMVISDDHQWVAENIEIGLRNRDVYGGVSIARSDFAKLKIGDKVVRYNFDCLTHKLSQRWLSDIYVVLDTRGVIAAIAKSATDTNIKYEYIGNLKKIIDDDE
ncbi:hypothetical protein FOL47_006283 [Perkinsus chesapeaki]|uniref:Uncharacterized protein n=1 Tax=Perkinsus chesapeaki TaxID=330153 RepID=A0A7J6MXK8_PERCH|nr:hypothetical protein FOL47_006283 [Perkinsus chesapeaki]